MRWGTPSVPVPAGTLGSLDGYECNQSTSQTNTDSAAGFGNHCFGATIALHGGVQAKGSAITATMDTAPGVCFGHDVNLTNNVAGGQMTGLFVGSPGSQKATPGVQLSGSFINGANFGNNNVIGVTTATLTNGPFSGLPTCGVNVSSGSMAMINDGNNTSTWGGTAAGGGIRIARDFCNGKNWTIAGK